MSSSSFMLDNLPEELKHKILEALPSLSEIARFRLVSKEHKELVDRFLTTPEVVITLLNILPPEQARKFVQTYPNLYEHECKNNTATSLQILLYALTVDDINKINKEQLNNAYNDVFASISSKSELTNLEKHLDSLKPNINILIEVCYELKNLTVAPQSKGNMILDTLSNIPVNKDQYINFQGINLNGAELTSGSDISGSYLSAMDLQNVKMANIKMNEADLSFSNISGGTFQDSSMLRINLSYVNATGANMSGALLGEANFHNANLKSCDFSGATLLNANLTGANLTGANFQNAMMINVTFLSPNAFDSILSLKSALETLHKPIQSSVDYPKLILAISEDISKQITKIAGSDPEKALSLIQQAKTTMYNMFESAYKVGTPLVIELGAKLPAKQVLEKCELEIQEIQRNQLRT